MKRAPVIPKHTLNLDRLEILRYRHQLPDGGFVNCARR